MTTARRELSVIVHTHNEYENIRELCTRLFNATKAVGLTAELLVVDDESKGTIATNEIVEDLKKTYPIRIHIRSKAEGRGLSSAVLLGFSKAKYETLLCMDADLQHAPESVPFVAQPVLSGEAEFSVGSRNVPGGGVIALASSLSGSTDPMSDCFCTTKTVLKRGEGRINPIGFKIGLELMVRCECKSVADVPTIFQGESKLTTKQNFLCLMQLAGLYLDRHPLIYLGLVGAGLVTAAVIMRGIKLI
uniref:dolichyl-phosphate beta-D-mannosyltransferase n=1 Tax=Lotharella oceanica TaxID=641309 RepID=A0A7S2TPG1_9EUKA|mmetsp:Transcript_23827/g.44501  ORF Transcript_23827/g.44501 Transcript_23827/m.44501 type:complete len:247 (+) Transcript_23827:102-842(+)